jgi:hypothetical protein
MTATIKIHRQRLISSAELYNDNIKNLTIEAEFFVKPKIVGDIRIYYPDANFISLEMAQGINSLLDQQEESISIPLFIEIANGSDYVDESLPGSKITDDEGDETRVIWYDWILPNHEIMNRDGRLFIGTNSYTGSDLTIESLSGVIGSLVSPNDLPDVVDTEI